MRVLPISTVRPVAIGRTLLQGMDTATLLRRGVLALAVLGILGTTIELVFLHHWTKPTQLIVWPAVVALSAAMVVLVVRPGRRALLAARVLALSVVLVSGVGIWLPRHREPRRGAARPRLRPPVGPMSTLDQWTAAIIGDVGPAPTLAPGALAEISFALLLATIRHPAGRSTGRDEEAPETA